MAPRGIPSLARILAAGLLAAGALAATGTAQAAPTPAGGDYKDSSNAVQAFVVDRT